MSLIFINYFIFLLIAFFNGKIFLDFFCKNIKNLNNFEQSIIGLILTGFIAQIINFFSPLNNLIVYLNIIIISIYFFLKFKKIINLRSLVLYVSIPVFFLVLVNIYGSSFSDDLNHYHHGAIVNSDTHNYIIGLNSMHNHYGFSSIWLILHSYLNFSLSRLQDIHILNGLILFLFLGFIFFEMVDEIKAKKETIYLPTLFFCLLFVLIKYTRLKEFGIDRSAFLIFFYIILFYIKHIALSSKDKLNDELKISILLLLSFFCTFIFFIKIIFIFTLILPITVFLLIDKKLLIFKNPLTYILGLLYVSYFAKNFLISGCLFYPIEPFCFTQLPWHETQTIKNLNFNIEVFNKSFPQYKGDLTPEEYIKNFSWVKNWLNRNVVELVEFFTLLSSIFIITILNFKNSLNDHYNKKKVKLFPLIVIVIMSILLIFLKTPVIRMSHHIFVLFFFILILGYLRNRVVIINKKIFFFLIIIAFTFNISKNLIRIKSTNFVNDPIYVLKKSGIYSKSEKITLDDFTYYKGGFDGHPIGYTKLDNYNYKKWFIFDMITKKLIKKSK